MQRTERAKSDGLKAQLSRAMAASEKLKQARSIVANTEAAIAAMELQVRASATRPSVWGPKP